MRAPEHELLAPQNSCHLQQGGHGHFCSPGQFSAESGSCGLLATDKGHLGSIYHKTDPSYHDLKPHCNKHPCTNIFGHVYSIFLPKNESLEIELLSQIGFIYSLFLFRFFLLSSVHLDSI